MNREPYLFLSNLEPFISSRLAALPRVSRSVWRADVLVLSNLLLTAMWLKFLIDAPLFCLLSAFFMKQWILSTAFLHLLIMWVFSILLVWCITLIDFQIVTYACIPG